jgi:hypothetical protein
MHHPRQLKQAGHVTNDSGADHVSFAVSFRTTARM